MYVPFIFRLGEYSLNSNDGTEQDFSVVKIFNHEHYNDNSMVNDISLLKLNQRANINKENLACLPASSGQVSSGKKCWVTGNIMFQKKKTCFDIFTPNDNSVGMKNDK